MSDTTQTTPNPVDKFRTMTAGELAALDMALLTPAEASAVDARLDELTTAADAERERKQRARERSQEAAARAFELDVLPGLVEKHGEVDVKIGVIPYVGGCVVVKKPERVFYQRFSDSKITSEDVEKLVRHSVVYPDKAKLDEIFDGAPGVMIDCGTKCVALARQARKGHEGK